MKNAVILTVYNRPELTLMNTLYWLAMNNLKDTEIIVVDDDSTVDYSPVFDSFEVMKLTVLKSETMEKCPDLYHLDGHKNPAWANNVAIANLSDDCERVFWLSSDVMLSANCLDLAWKWADDGYMWSPTVMDIATGVFFLSQSRQFPGMWAVGMRRELVEPFDLELMKGMAFDDQDFLGAAFKKGGHFVIDGAAKAFHQSHALAYMADGGEGYRRTREYMKSKWRGAIPFGENGRPFGWYVNEVGGSIIMSLDKGSKPDKIGPVTTESPGFGNGTKTSPQLGGWTPIDMDEIRKMREEDED